MPNLTLAFAELLGGGVLLVAGATGTSVPDTIRGNVTMHPLEAGSSGSTTATTPASSGSAPSSGAGSVTPAMLQQIGSQYGWSGAQLSDWLSVINAESGGDPTARNPSSGAYGIGQFLGSTLTEYAPYGATSSDPAQQLQAMARYIHDRYGSPAAAWAHEQSNKWY